VQWPNAGGEPRARAGAKNERRLLRVGFRVEPVLTHPALPPTRTCAMNASGSSGARVSACLWRITVLPCMAVRCCGRSWVWADQTSPAASGTFPHRLGSYCYDDAASTATPAPRSDGLPLAGGNALGYQRTESAHVTAGLTAGIGLARARDDGCDTTATRPAWCASGASWRSCV
jgi:hypothetical protein